MVHVTRRSVLAALGVGVAGVAGGWGVIATGRDDEPASVAELEQPVSTLALVGARLLDVEGDRIVSPATIVIEDGTITAVEAGEAAPRGATVADLGGASVLPAFLDAHVHVQFADAAAIAASGVATVRDLGSPPEARAAHDDDLVRLLHAGRILTSQGGYPTRSWGADGSGREVTAAGEDGGVDAREAIAEQVSEGATIVKVALSDAGGRPLLDRETLDAIVEAADAAGLEVTAHVGSQEGLGRALAASITELAHLPLYDVEPIEMLTAGEAGLRLCPTLAVRANQEGVADAIAAFRSGGGRLVYGTDLGHPAHGDATTPAGLMRTEIEALLAAGLTPLEVLTSATSVAADELGLANTGSIAPGYRADLVALDGDPLDDVDAYDRRLLSVVGGRVALDARNA